MERYFSILFTNYDTKDKTSYAEVETYCKEWNEKNELK